MPVSQALIARQSERRTSAPLCHLGPTVRHVQVRRSPHEGTCCLVSNVEPLTLAAARVPLSVSATGPNQGSTGKLLLLRSGRKY